MALVLNMLEAHEEHVESDGELGTDLASCIAVMAKLLEQVDPDDAQLVTNLVSYVVTLIRILSEDNGYDPVELWMEMVYGDDQ